MKLVEAGPVTDEEFEALIEAGDFEREPELIDGYIEWRDAEMATITHGAWVTAIVVWFSSRAEQWNINAYPGVTNKTAPLNSLIPDVTVLSLDARDEKYVTGVPLAVFEVLSPKQSKTVLKAKFAKYEQKGIKQIWLINPDKGVWQRHLDGRLTGSDQFTGVGTIPPFSMLEISKLVR